MNEVQEAITRVYQEEWARMVCSLASRFGHLDIAEETAAEAFSADIPTRHRPMKWSRDKSPAPSRKRLSVWKE